jgi:iron(III) transport system permease protein
MFRVTIPAVRPSLGAAGLLMVWFAFALFSVPAIIGTGAGIDVLSVRMVEMVNFTYPPNLEAAIGLGFIIILAVGTAWFLQKRVLARARHATIGGKGNSFTRIELGRLRIVARLILLSYILIAAVLPLLALLLVSLNGFWTPWVNWSGLNFNAFTHVLFGNPQTSLSLRNSIFLGLVGATIGTFAAATLALFVRKYGGPATAVVDAVVKLPASVSSIVLAVGFILAFSGPPFNLNGTLLILLLGYLVLYMPQASVAADAAAAQVGKELTEASHISGAGAGRTFLRISLPLMVAGMVAGWMLLFVRMISDLTVSAVLAGSNNPVVGFRILEIYEGGNFATLAALSSVLTLISAVVVTSLMIFTKRMTRTSSAAT